MFEEVDCFLFLLVLSDLTRFLLFLPNFDVVELGEREDEMLEEVCHEVGVFIVEIFSHSEHRIARKYSRSLITSEAEMDRPIVSVLGASLLPATLRRK